MPSIQQVQRAGGVRYRFTLSLGRDPATGNRRQRVYTFDDLKAAERERARLTGQLADGRFTSSMTTFSNWTGYQTHGVSADPQFVNAAAGDYQRFNPPLSK